jgi:hypothetical protein
MPKFFFVEDMVKGENYYSSVGVRELACLRMYCLLQLQVQLVMLLLFVLEKRHQGNLPKTPGTPQMDLRNRCSSVRFDVGAQRPSK